MKKLEQHPLTVVIRGGDEVERDLVGSVFYQGLVRGGFEKIHCVDIDGNDANPEKEETTLYDMIDRLRPNLFKTPVTIKTGEHFPEQHTYVNDLGFELYRPNVLVRHLLDNGGISWEDLAKVHCPLEDRQQFAQLVGYSVSGYDDLSYSPATLAAERVERAHEQMERIRHHGAGTVSHIEVVARDNDEPLDPKDIAVEVPAEDSGGDEDGTAP